MVTGQAPVTLEWKITSGGKKQYGVECCWLVAATINAIYRYLAIK